MVELTGGGEHRTKGVAGWQRVRGLAPGPSRNRLWLQVCAVHTSQPWHRETPSQAQGPPYGATPQTLALRRDRVRLSPARCPPTPPHTLRQQNAMAQTAALIPQWSARSEPFVKHQSAPPNWAASRLDNGRRRYRNAAAVAFRAAGWRSRRRRRGTRSLQVDRPDDGHAAVGQVFDFSQVPSPSRSARLARRSGTRSPAPGRRGTGSRPGGVELVGPREPAGHRRRVPM